MTGESPDHLIVYAREIRSAGEKKEMDFSAFDTKKRDEYAARARETWGKTAAYQEYERKSVGRSEADTMELSWRMMDIFAEFGAVREEDPACEKAQDLVRKLRDFISANY